tara:strand:- start:4379 stop:5983 length:1605 start_codon:yes stop_codon:yes gene_type:complete
MINYEKIFRRKSIFIYAFISILLLQISNLYAAKKPNFLVILTDDLGFSDLGCYGSEIETPNLDHLAKNGVRFTQFYNTGKCHSSRVSLLSGRWCRQAGDIELNQSVIIPEILKENGYFTAISGKWHLTGKPEDFGFEHYFGHLSGATDYFKGNSSFRLNGKPWKIPKGFYSTTYKVDYSLEFLKKARKTKKPWFLYLAFNAPHAPLQPLKEDYEKYLGKYNEGWDVIQQRRFDQQQKLKLFREGVKLPPRPDHVKSWKNLSAVERKWEKMRMAAYAGMVDRVDKELGRLFKDLKNNNELDNTVIIFLSDNGACPYDRRKPTPDSLPYAPKSKWPDSTGWAWVRNTPFRFYKQNQFEGGVTTPCIVHWPAGLKMKPGSVNHTPAHIVDILPTLADLSASIIPDKWPGRELTPLSGTSLRAVFEGEKLTSRPPIHFKFGKDSAYRDGDWKLVSFKGLPWELYNIQKDRTEMNNLSLKYPERVKEMNEKWLQVTKEMFGRKNYDGPALTGDSSKKTNPEWTGGPKSTGAIKEKRKKK